MGICRRCRGSGNLFRPKKGLPLSKSFKVCTDCGGRGTSHPPLGPRTIHAHTPKKKKPPRE